MKVHLNWFDTGYRSTRPKKKAKAKAKATRPVAKPKPKVRAAPVVARAARKPKPPAAAPVVAPAAPAVAPARKRAASSGTRWIKEAYDVVHESGRLRSVHGEVLLPERVWGVNATENSGFMLTHVPSGALVCSGSSVAALKKVAVSIPDVGPGWGSAEFLKIARAILARKSFKTPPWWGEASDEIRRACP